MLAQAKGTANPKGELTAKAGGKTYRLHLGMSVLADLQERFGSDLDAALSAPEDGKLPNLQVMHAIFLGALQRYHGDEVDRYTVDDIIAENQNAFGDLLGAAFPAPAEDVPEENGKTEGNGKAAA